MYQLCERSLSLLKEGATQHRELWSGLGAEAIERAARFPFLIVDVHFIDEAWWRTVLLNPQGSIGRGGVGWRTTSSNTCTGSIGVSVGVAGSRVQ